MIHIFLPPQLPQVRDTEDIKVIEANVKKKRRIRRISSVLPF